MNNLIWLIPLLPLLGFLLNGIINKKMPNNLVGIIGSGSVFISFILSLLAFNAVSSEPSKSILTSGFEWITAGNLKISFSFLIDHLSAVFLLVVTGVGFLIHVYSIGYMSHDEDYPRYFAYLNLFVFFMLLLVMGSNYIVMFAGWEGVGLCSYLLIGFWFKNKEYNNAAKKAFVMNRIGDLGFLIGIFLIFLTFGSLDYQAVFESAKNFGSANPVITTITICLFIGAMGKSAQIPLYTWLPDAMAGPTPVSALIHAATMVTAGIYMIVRSNILYALSPFTSELVAIVGLATAVFAATIGLRQNDIKKVLAYSTVSQLGYMFVALGVGAYTTGIFHVVTHAFFKALLFLCAGSVIHAMSGEQDVRKMGGLKKALPITHLTFLIGTLAITGVPPFAGFFSKDEILAVTYNHSFWMFVILSVTSVLTAVYMFRLYFLTFYGNFRGTHHQQEHLHESPSSMTFPLIILAILSAAGGFLGMPELFHVPHFLYNFLEPVIALHSTHNVSESFEIGMIVTSIVALILIIYFVYNYYIGKNNQPEEREEQLPAFGKVLYNKYYVDELYSNLITKPLDWISKQAYKFIELRFIDGIVNGFGVVTNGASSMLRYVQTGNIGFYVFGMVLGIILIFVLKFFI